MLDKRTPAYDRKIYYLLQICSYSDVTSIEQMNYCGSVSKFFLEHEDILQRLSKVNPERMVQIIPNLNLVFTNLRIKGVNRDILGLIFDSCMYQLNPLMIQRVVEYKDAARCGQLYSKNYSTIISLGYDPLIDYVHNNWDVYVDNIVLSGRKQNDNITQIIDLVKRSLDSVERCVRIIQVENCSLSNISLCCGELIPSDANKIQKIWNALLVYNKIEISWENINIYWNNFKLTDTLVEYISEHIDILIKRNSECLTNEFKHAVIEANIPPVFFEKILPVIAIKEFNIPLKVICSSNVAILIDQHFFEFSAEKYDELAQAYPEFCVSFILQNQSSFAEEMEEISITLPVLEALICSEKVDMEIKQKAIERYGCDLMSTTIAKQLCTQNISIGKNIFDAAWNILSVDGKQLLLFNHLCILDDTDLERYFAELSKPYQEFSDRTRRHSVFLDKTDQNLQLAEYLSQIGYITSFEETSEKKYSTNHAGFIVVPSIRCRVRAVPQNQ